MPVVSKFDLCSAALVAFGARRISSFDDGTAESTVAGTLYDFVVREELAKNRWNFAKSFFALNRLPAGPDHRWHFLWQLPEDCLVLHAVYAAGHPIDYEQYDGRTVATNDENPVAEYTRMLTEDQWPVYFETLIKVRLEAHFQGSLLKDPSIKDALLRAQDTPPNGAFSKARALDAQSQPPRKMPVGALVRRRRM